MRPLRKSVHSFVKLQPTASALQTRKTRIRSLKNLFISPDFSHIFSDFFASPILILFAYKSHPFSTSYGRIVCNVKAPIKVLSTKLTKELVIGAQAPP